MLVLYRERITLHFQHFMNNEMKMTTEQIVFVNIVRLDFLVHPPENITQVLQLYLIRKIHRIDTGSEKWRIPEALVPAAVLQKFLFKQAEEAWLFRQHRTPGVGNMWIIEDQRRTVNLNH